LATAAILNFFNPPSCQYKNKLLKIQKFKDFNGNGYLQGVRHVAPYGDHFGLLWWPFVRDSSRILKLEAPRSL
jgi:hypothetical protein